METVVQQHAFRVFRMVPGEGSVAGPAGVAVFRRGQAEGWDRVGHVDVEPPAVGRAAIHLVAEAVLGSHPPVDPGLVGQFVQLVEVILLEPVLHEAPDQLLPCGEQWVGQIFDIVGEFSGLIGVIGGPGRVVGPLYRVCDDIAGVGIGRRLPGDSNRIVIHFSVIRRTGQQEGRGRFRLINPQPPGL